MGLLAGFPFHKLRPFSAGPFNLPVGSALISQSTSPPLSKKRLLAETMFTPTESGMVTVDGGVLTYQSAHYGVWWLPLTATVKIEEYTHSAGPFIDDYFYRFSTVTGEERSASVYAVGWEEVWPALEVAFPGLENPGLCNSAESKVRLLWQNQKETTSHPTEPASPSQAASP